MDSYHNQPKTTVAAIISEFKEGNEYILLTKRKIEPYINKWCLPGGHINNYESAKNAVIREVREETGLDYQPLFYNYFDEIIPDQNIHAVVLAFTGTSGGSLVRDNSEISDAKWTLLDDALNYEFAFQHNEILKHYRANKVN